MIIDDLLMAKKYYGLHCLFRKAFEHLRELDWKSLEVGRYELQGEDLFYMVMVGPPVSRQSAIARFECHNKYIDIQLCISGHETFGWKPRRYCQALTTDSKGSDNNFATALPDSYFQLKEGQFVIFFPDDVHAAMMGRSRIKKIVVKVRLDDIIQVPAKGMPEIE